MTDCIHKDLVISVNAYRDHDEKPKKWVAGVSVSCLTCKQPFRFFNKKDSDDWWQSVGVRDDNMELYIPMEPATTAGRKLNS